MAWNVDKRVLLDQPEGLAHLVVVAVAVLEEPH
jgi:hypothetical protein